MFKPYLPLSPLRFLIIVLLGGGVCQFPLLAQTNSLTATSTKQVSSATTESSPANRSAPTLFGKQAAVPETSAATRTTQELSVRVSPITPVKNALPVTGSIPEINALVGEFCRLYKIDERLIFAQMRQESSFKVRATSYKGAAGLMQLMPATARRFGVTEIYDPRQNIEAGIKYMRFLLDLFGDVRLALAGYNAGEGAVLKYNRRIPPYRETIQYVEKICYYYYGETGHGTAFAWNLPQAVRFASEVYSANRPLALVVRSKTDERSLPDNSRSDANVTNQRSPQKTPIKVGQNDRPLIQNNRTPSPENLSPDENTGGGKVRTASLTLPQ